MSTFEDFMIDEAVKSNDEMRKLQAKYNELLYAVARVFPGEARHQTALRYIRAAEQRANEPGEAKCEPCCPE